MSGVELVPQDRPHLACPISMINASNVARDRPFVMWTVSDILFKPFIALMRLLTCMEGSEVFNAICKNAPANPNPSPRGAAWVLQETAVTPSPKH